MADDILWYIPNQTRPGHRGDDADEGHNSLDTLTRHATELERHGWDGALLGTSWGRPDTFTVASALAARTTTFEPLIAIRPGYWSPAHLASASATLDHLTGGRVRINIVSGQDDLAAYGDAEGDQAARYARTHEFLRIVRRLWTRESVTYHGEHFRVTGSTPGRAGGGGAGTTWLVGTAREVAGALRKYEALGVTHFVLSDTPYLPEIERQGRDLVPLLRGRPG